MNGPYILRNVAWYVYMLRCADGTLYTGMTNNPEHRLAAHNDGRGAKYTRGRRPVELVYCENCTDRSAALRQEAAIKHLTRAQKLALLCNSIPPARGTMEHPEKEENVLMPVFE